MKKILYVFLICFVLFITGCGKDDSKSPYHEIDYKEYKAMIDNGDTFAMVVGSSTCSACSLFKETMSSFVNKYHVDVKYIDISKLSEDDYNLLSSDINFKSTPTTIFVKDGKHLSSYYRIVGAESFSNVVAAYKRMGYIDGE